MTIKMQTIEEYRTEFAVEGISTLIYRLIFEIIKKTAPSYPASRYGSHPVWDEDAVGDICQEYMLTRLIRTPRLAYFLLAADNSDGLYRLISHDFRQFLISRRRRTEYTNLFTRVRTLLISNPQYFHSPSLERSGAQALWGLTAWNQREIVQDLNEVLVAMGAVNLPPLIIYRPDSTRHSHLITAEDLSRLIEETLTTLGRWLQLQLMMDGLRYRLNLVEAEAISLDEMEEGADSSHQYAAISVSTFENPDTVVPLRQMAEEIFDRLTDRQRLVLTLRLTPPEPTLEQIGQQVSISKSTVANDLLTIEQIFRSAEVEVVEGDQVLAYLLELCEQTAQRSHAEFWNGISGRSSP